MNLTEKFLALTLLGSEWVLWLLVGLSVASIAVMIERARFFSRRRVDLPRIVEQLRLAFGRQDMAAATSILRGRLSMETKVALAGLEEASSGPAAASEAMAATRTRERLQAEHNLVFLGTLGNNAPFIGLFGTVLGIIRAFHDLAANQQGGASVVMAGISEALVATALGLLVAIPAVVAFNFFQRRVRASVAAADGMAHLVLAHLREVGPGALTACEEAPGEAAPGKAAAAAERLARPSGDG